MRIVEIIPDHLYGGGMIIGLESWRFMEENVDVILNLRQEQDHPPFDFTNRLMIWAPIADEEAPDLRWVITVTNIMNVLLDTGHTLYVHDTSGINRLGFILTAFYMQRFGLTRDLALFEIRKKKPDVRPREWYMNLLSEYEEYLERGC